MIDWRLMLGVLALMLPLAIPAYVMAFVAIGLLVGAVVLEQLDRRLAEARGPVGELLGDVADEVAFDTPVHRQRHDQNL